MIDVTPDELACRFHETYERLAPSFGYETRRESAVSWDEVPERNRSLMTAVCAEVLDALLARLTAVTSEASEHEEAKLAAYAALDVAEARLTAAEANNETQRTRVGEALDRMGCQGHGDGWEAPCRNGERPCVCTPLLDVLEITSDRDRPL